MMLLCMSFNVLGRMPQRLPVSYNLRFLFLLLSDVLLIKFYDKVLLISVLDLLALI